MITNCLFSALITIAPGLDRAQLDEPAFKGVCISRKAPEAYVNEFHQLIIESHLQVFEIPLPPHDGAFHLRYQLGSERADLEKWGSIMVRFGHKGGL